MAALEQNLLILETIRRRISQHRERQHEGSNPIASNSVPRTGGHVLTQPKVAPLEMAAFLAIFSTEAATTDWTRLDETETTLTGTFNTVISRTRGNCMRVEAFIV